MTRLQTVIASGVIIATFACMADGLAGLIGAACAVVFGVMVGLLLRGPQGWHSDE